MHKNSGGGLNPYLTVETTDTVTAVRHRVAGYALLAAILGSGGSLVLATLAGQNGWIEYTMLPAILLAASTMKVLLWQNRLSVRTVEIFFALSLGVYQITSLISYALSGAMYEYGFSSTALWFPLFYPVAFMVFKTRTATRVSLAYYLVALVFGLIGLALHGPPNPSVNNSLIQFYVASPAYLLLFYVYVQWRREYASMRYMAHTDTLTGLPNRRQMQQLLQNEIARANRYTTPFAVLLVDLDFFKEVNDRFGHAVGDEVLKEVGFRLCNALRVPDTLARWGGEEFMVLAPATSDPQACELAERLAQVVRETPFIGKIQLTTSIGVVCHKPGDILENMINRADRALYRAKHLGRNSVVTDLSMA